MAYITRQETQKYLGLNIGEEVQTIFDLFVSGVERYIEKYTGRKFEAPDSNTIRYYDGNGATKLAIDDLRSLTELEVAGDVLTEGEDFYLWPLNAEEDNEPYTHIVLIQPESRVSFNSRISTATHYVFDELQKSVKVTGKFGYSVTPPDDVKLAALKLVGGIIKENIGDADVREISSHNIDLLQVNYTQISEVAHRLGVNDILKQYQRKPTAKAGWIKAS